MHRHRILNIKHDNISPQVQRCIIMLPSCVNKTRKALHWHLEVFQWKVRCHIFINAIYCKLMYCPGWKAVISALFADVAVVKLWYLIHIKVKVSAHCIASLPTMVMMMATGHTINDNDDDDLHQRWQSCWHVSSIRWQGWGPTEGGRPWNASQSWHNICDALINWVHRLCYSIVTSQSPLPLP